MPLALDYAVAHHQLEGADVAARQRDSERLAWYWSLTPADLAHWLSAASVGPRVVIRPETSHFVSSPMSETPYVLLAPEVPGAGSHGGITADAAHYAASTGFGALVSDHAPIACHLRNKQLGDTLDSWTISRLPGTVFLDLVDEPAVHARDLIHEAAHNWLNDAFAAAEVRLPAASRFYSPWKGRRRPAFGYLHACWAFPLTMLYAAEVLPHAGRRARRFLDAFLTDQRRLLAATAPEYPRALSLLPDPDLASRLGLVYEAAQQL